MIRDSFGDRLWPLFSETFSRADYLYPPSMTFRAREEWWIDQTSPDLVIQEFSERNLGKPIQHFRPFGDKASKD